MPTRLRFGIVAMCDNVYTDVATNKIVLAGLYSGPIVATSFPAATRASYYIEVWSDATSTHEADFQIHLNGTHLGGSKVTLEFQRTDAPSVLIMPPYEFLSEGSGELEILALIDGESPVSILKKSIILDGQSPTVSPPPLARSRRGARAKASKL